MMPSGTTGTILVGDSVESEGGLFEVVLSAHNYGVVVKTGGRETLEFLRTQTPELIILEAYLPEVDGLDICHRIKRIKRLQRVPVIILINPKDGRAERGAQLSRADLVLTRPLMGKAWGSIVFDLLAKGRMQA